MNAPSDREVLIFSAVLDLPASQRGAYLQEACADDHTLRLHLEALLRVHEEASGFLEIPASGKQESPMWAEVSAAAATSPSSPAEKAGDHIGRYKLLQQIGEGGCGMVYMAEQEEPVRRRVAIKVIKLGMDTKQVVARFEAERQALALMDHQNIAKVFDAGATDTGRPFFVMELVRGVKITEYCDQNNLSTEERLKLFTQVCQAIQHAHQKGIIHRDIKPSNILVTISEPGAPGCPKVIDFGIAKATTGQHLTDKTVFTAFEQFIGTPAYMSPEQAMMTSLDIDTRTDIYALGVLLYELLTGQTPFDSKELMAAGLDAMRRIIREGEPVRPSTRLSTMLASDLSTVARHRKAEPARLGTILSGDLDWIVMKALEKDRSRRYETVNGLAMDVQRYLADEPIVARPPSGVYRLQKMVRRNKPAFAAASTVVASLIVGLAISTWQFIEKSKAEREQSRLRVRAEAEQNKAQTEASKSQQVAEFLKTMLQGVGPSKARGRDATMLREILDQTAERVGKGLTNQPEVAVELYLTLAHTYHDLGLYKQMEVMARQSLQLARRSLGAENESVATSLSDLGDALMHLGETHAGSLQEAEKYCREGVAMNRKLLGNDNPKVALALHHLANVLLTQGRMAEAETVHREVLAMYQKLIDDKHPKVSSVGGDGSALASGQIAV